MKDVDISVVIPCLNEEKTIKYCIEKAKTGIKNSGLNGEIIVSDNGSIDDSIKIASEAGATVLRTDDIYGADLNPGGYGSGLNGGIKAAKGKYIIMGDSDSTYDFEDIPKFVKELSNGNDLVIGNRFSGGIAKGAMPFLNRYLGNPLLSYIARKLFSSKIRDFNCGIRGFTKEAYSKMDLKSTGMEFATEMIAKASLLNLNIGEVPTTLSVSISPRTPHLKPFRDGIRVLSLLITYGFITLFNKSFNFILSIFIPIYLILILFSPFEIQGIEISFGALSVLQNIVIVTLTLKSMLRISSRLFPEFIQKDNVVDKEKDHGLLFLFIGVSLYLIEFFYWGSLGFGDINQIYNIKILSLASVFLIYGIFESFRIFIFISLKYFVNE
jgi:glycosyltransferase involved in cell wall biosynthesis